MNTPRTIDANTYTEGLSFLLDTLVKDIADVHPSDRLRSAAAMLGRPSLVSNTSYRRAFSTWRREAGL